MMKNITFSLILFSFSMSFCILAEADECHLTLSLAGSSDITVQQNFQVGISSLCLGNALNHTAPNYKAHLIESFTPELSKLVYGKCGVSSDRILSATNDPQMNRCVDQELATLVEKLTHSAITLKAEYKATAEITL